MQKIHPTGVHKEFYISLIEVLVFMIVNKITPKYIPKAD